MTVLVLDLTPIARSNGVKVGSPRFTLDDLVAAYQKGATEEAMQIAEAMLSTAETYEPLVDAKIQFILAWALTERGWHQMAQNRLERIVATLDKLVDSDQSQLRTMVLCQYAVTLYKFMVNDPDAYRRLCRQLGFDGSAGIMQMLDQEIAKAGNPDSLRGLYRQTEYLLSRLRASTAA